MAIGINGHNSVDLNSAYDHIMTDFIIIIIIGLLNGKVDILSWQGCMQPCHHVAERDTLLLKLEEEVRSAADWLARKKK